jgi:YVTN family beta-propeller protein
LVLDTATNNVIGTVELPDSPGPLAINNAGTRVYVGQTNSILVLDTASNTVIATVPVLFPNFVAVNNAGTRVYVTNRFYNTVTVIDADSNTVIATVPAGLAPQGVAVNPTGTRIYVANSVSLGNPYRGTVTVIDTANYAVIATIPEVGRNPENMAVNPAGTRVYVTNANNGGEAGQSAISVIDTTCNSIIATVPVGYSIMAIVPVGVNPSNVAINPAGTRVYVTHREISTIGLTGAVSVIDTASNAVIATVPVGLNPYDVAVNPAGTNVYVVNEQSDSVSVLDTTSNTVIATVPAGGYSGSSPYFVSIASGVAPPPVVGPDPATSLRVTGMEVTQAIQDLANSVPLISGRRTFVRVYVRSDGPAVPGVTAALTGSGSYTTIGGEVTVPLGSLAPVNAVGPRITVSPSPKRSNLDDSFLFELPYNWTNFAALRLHAALTANPGPPAQGCPNDTLGEPIHEFGIPTTLKIQFVRLAYPLTDTADAEASTVERDQSESFIRRSYPLSVLLPTLDARMFDAGLRSRVERTADECKDLKTDEKTLCAQIYITSRLAALQASSGFMGDADAAYGLIPQGPAIPFARGACCTDSIGAGPSNIPDYAAHEIGHFLGRSHPVAGAEECGHSDTDPNYPYWLSFIGPGILGPVASIHADTDLAGFDGGDTSLSLPMTYFYGQNAFDIMGYCRPNKWVSDYTYRGLYTSLLALHSDIGRVTFGSGVVAGGPGPEVPQMGDWLMLFGSISPDPATASLIQTQRVDRVVSIPPRTPGDHSIRLVGAGGTVLADYPFVPETIEEGVGASGVSDTSLSFGQVVPFVAGTRQIQIVDTSTGSAVIGAKNVSPNPPVITDVALQDGPDPDTGALTVRWTASDPDEDPLTFDVFLVRDGGDGSESLLPLMLGLSDTSVEIDTTPFGGGSAQIRVVATDGVQTAFADSPLFTLDDKPPQPRILSPGNGTTIHLGQLVNLEGVATDLQLQEGQVPDTTLDWTTPDRALGSGARISITDLPVGTNLITLTATDGFGLTGSTSIIVNVKDNEDLPGPTLTAGPGQIGWHVAVGESQLQTAELNVGNSGGGNLEFTAQSNAPWLTLSAATGTAPATLTLTADPTGFLEGTTEEASVTITAVGIPDQMIMVPVTLAVGNTFVVGSTTPVVDQCPDDPDKTQPGACGCGIADTEAGQACTTGQPGICSSGTTLCAGGSASCVQNQQPSAEVCDGLDNNCNGLVDDNLSGLGQTCTVSGQLGLCRLGTTACMAGAPSCVQTTQASPEVCNGFDNDCNGVVDNGCAPVCAKNVSAQVKVTRGGFRRNSVTGRYVQQVTLKNTGSQPVSGSVSLVLDNLSGNATLFNKTGDSGCATPVGPYETVAVGTDGVLSAAESAQVVLEFTNPSNKGITYSTRVLAGTPR